MSSALKGVKLNQKAGQQAPAKLGQVKNNAGGYVFMLSPEQQLRRFLILGTDGGTFYQSERELTAQNAAMVLSLMGDKQSGLMAIKVAEEVSLSGRAPRNQPALFVLALGMASPVDEVRRAAYLALPKIARTGYHLFVLMEFVKNTQESFGGMGFRKALRRWYQDRPVDKLALQLVKYRQREGWTHRDVLRLAKPVPASDAERQAYHFAAGKMPMFDDGVIPKLIEGFLKVQEAGEKLTDKQAVALISEYNLPWEAIPDHVKSSPQVWAALLPNMGATALVRQLPTLTRVGLLNAGSDGTKFVVSKLSDQEYLSAGRIHPFNALLAGRIYGLGKSLKGSSTWKPVPEVVKVLEEAFYLSFGNVQPTGARIELDLDVSSSMAQSTLYNSPISAREASAAMALVTMSVEEDVSLYGFVGAGSGGRYGWGRYGDSKMIPLEIERGMTLQQVVKRVSGLPFGRTDCSLPMLSATAESRGVDAFVIYTDNDTWAGHVHPFQAMKDYCAANVAGARLAVVGMTATGFTIADPSDAGMLDVVGFDSATPNLISSFILGEF